MENLIEHIITKALVSGVSNYMLWERLYTLNDKTRIDVKQVMKNHIQVEEVSVTKQDHHCF
jgi:uncharacterized protein (DUF111 family)